MPGQPSFLPSPPEIRAGDCEMDGLEHETQSSKAAAAARLQSIRNVVQTQLSLEIVLKHKELRLIDQEIAKCQISLEQLRRCTEIPYPGTEGPSLAVSEGTGHALRGSFPTPLPKSPAPWGVTNGPYTRHYASWLLPDHRFDGGEPEPVSSFPAGKSPLKSRSTRGSIVDVPQASSASRSQRSGKLKALPAGYGHPKEKATGPMIVKRKSDGRMVKLVCPDCGRHDFGSAQGFINHCRIGHGRSFASHDAAADACGEPVEIDDSGAMVGIEPVATPTGGNVHPLIRSAKLLQPSAPRTAQSSPSSDDDGRVVKSKEVSPDFKGSVLTPNLSELVKVKGLGFDLQEMVIDAKQKVEMPESDSEDDQMDVDVPMQNTAQGRHPQVAGTKQPSKSTKSPMSSPLLSTSMSRSAASTRSSLPQFDGAADNTVQQRPRGIDIPTEQTSMTEMQPSDPSPTSESNQAPSLVDDDEEFEPHSPTSSSVSDEQDVGEVDFEVRGDEDDDARSVLRGPDFQPSCTQPARPTGHVRRPSAIRRQGEDREEKHVTFVSPSPARDLPAPRQAGDRKRRKA
ncbi:ADA HAT complex component 1 [Capronia coronata CBS 617.96]|uniref:ADA HAT complex component 1 n=1 Tax=Capronia coronata CBS 617.96 TaxID=1182541 RepID=W9Y9M5_9EURO|nr:ADA HAT complex component 1 [Capronia coronata CBS 617.96]EXJ85931.1 ADA HAT complex component 1 [Capronia coronata CBS 617.96]